MISLRWNDSAKCAAEISSHMCGRDPLALPKRKLGIGDRRGLLSAPLLPVKTGRDEAPGEARKSATRPRSGNAVADRLGGAVNRPRIFQAVAQVLREGHRSARRSARRPSRLIATGPELLSSAALGFAPCRCTTGFLRRDGRVICVPPVEALWSKATWKRPWRTKWRAFWKRPGYTGSSGRFLPKRRRRDRRAESFGLRALPAHPLSRLFPRRLLSPPVALLSTRRALRRAERRRHAAGICASTTSAATRL